MIGLLDRQHPIIFAYVLYYNANVRSVSSLSNLRIIYALLTLPLSMVWTT
jgi:hypothetical protein